MNTLTGEDLERSSVSVHSSSFSTIYFGTRSLKNLVLSGLPSDRRRGIWIGVRSIVKTYLYIFVCVSESECLTNMRFSNIQSIDFEVLCKEGYFSIFTTKSRVRRCLRINKGLHGLVIMVS